MSDYKSSELNELFSALALAQQEMKVATKDSSNPFFKSKYANLQAIVESARPALCKNGLSVLQYVNQGEDGLDYLCTVLGHKSGQYITSRMKIAPAKQDVQSLGSYITYLRRYAYAAITGVYDGEDDDGNSASHESVASEHQLAALLNTATPQFLQTLLSKYNIRDIRQLTESQVRSAIEHCKIKKG